MCNILNIFIVKNVQSIAQFKKLLYLCIRNKKEKQLTNLKQGGNL